MKIYFENIYQVIDLLRMKLYKSCCSSKRSIEEAVESTWYQPYKRIKSRRYDNILFFTSSMTILDSWNYKYTCKHIIIGSLVKSIPEECFADFKYLHTVTFQNPSSLETINSGAFRNCTKLTDIKLPNIRSIEKFVFDDCVALKSITIPTSVSSIGSFAFNDCKSLNDIILPVSITNIGRYAFMDCSALTNIVIPPTVTKIRKGTFSGCSQLISLCIPPSVSVIEDYAFEYCHSLKSMTLLPSVQNIGVRVFNDCKKLRVLHIPSTDHVVPPRYSFLNDYPVTFRNFDKNLIILADENKSGDNEIWEPVMILHDIHYACLYGLEENLDKEIQMKALYNVFQKFFPIPAFYAEAFGMNLLHILVHFPNNSTNIYEIMQELLEKCPMAAMSMDCDGRTPIHCLLEFNSMRDNMMIELLLTYTDHTILHKALQSKSASWKVVESIIYGYGTYGYGDIISSIDESSGLFPFMTAALGDNSNLTIVFKLLQMKPDVLIS